MIRRFWAWITRRERITVDQAGGEAFHAYASTETAASMLNAAQNHLLMAKGDSRYAGAHVADCIVCCLAHLEIEGYDVEAEVESALDRL